MGLQRCRPSIVTLGRRLLVAFGLLSFIAAGARAQQVFINSLWVSRGDAGNCTGPDGNGHYFCVAPSGNTPPCPNPPNENISNNPHIEFDQFVPPASQAAADCAAASFPLGTVSQNVCNSRVFLCENIGYSNNQSGNASFALDEVKFEVFKYQGGANPFAPESTPPLRTFFVDAPGQVPAGSAGVTPAGAQCGAIGSPCGFCVLWDGSINIQGEYGKSNGQFGFRGSVATNQTGANGNVNISQVRSYPTGSTFDATAGACGGGGLPGTVEQKPITVDVTDVHVVRTTSAIVGTFSGVLAEPYSLTYRLSKDATMFISIADTAGTGLPIVRHLVNGLPRVGEGIPDGTIQNGDAWDGRADNGDLVPSGVFLATLQAQARDQYGMDLSASVTRQISLDPLQITDILVQPLTGQSTSLAVLTYTLTEPATAFVDIYPPGTQFCNGLNDVNNAGIVPDDPNNNNPPKNFGPTLGVCGGPVIPPLRRIVEQKNFRAPVVSFWDGRDSNGNVLPDGDYVFVLYAALPSQNGFGFNGSSFDRRIWSSRAKSGFLTISRGLVAISQVSPATTVIGASPTVAGLNPFVFSYSLSRDAIVNMRVFDATGTRVKKTLVKSEVRPGNLLNREIWADATDDNGLLLSSGAYLVELTAADPFFPSKVSTTTAMFQINLFRITDVFTTPLQANSTDFVTLSYQLSQTMNVAWNLYGPGTVIQGSSSTWPPCGVLTPGVCGQTLNPAGQPTAPFRTIQGLRPGRLRTTEFWDGRDTNGLFLPDGNYVFTLAAQSTTTPQYFATDRVYGFLTIARGAITFPVFTIAPTVPTLFNSSASITLPPFEMDYTVTRQSSVTIQILNTTLPPRVVRTIIAGQVRDTNILEKEFWDARDDAGNFVKPGFYTVQAVANDLASQLSTPSTVQQTIAVDPLRIYDVAVSPLRKEDGNALIAYQVSETMKTAVKIYKPGTSFDANSNPSPPEAVSLVRRIVGVRAARTEITETWDGKDSKLSVVPDGNYLFKIVGSTDIFAIDSITGNVVPGASLAEDVPVNEVPVVRGSSADPQKEMEENTFIYPNPVSGASGTFNIFVPMQAKVTLKIFNFAGELVFDRDFDNQAPTFMSPPVSFLWPKINSAGRGLAPGVYFALVREEGTLGDKSVLQTVKKILLP